MGDTRIIAVVSATSAQGGGLVRAITRNVNSRPARFWPR